LGWILSIHPNTLCNLFSDTKGIQWVDANASVVYDPQQAHVYMTNELEGFMEEPFALFKNHYPFMQMIFPNDSFSFRMLGFLVIINDEMCIHILFVCVH
jgi:hypothetical protein